MNNNNHYTDTQPPANVLAPHSLEGEEAVLGSVLLNPDVLENLIGFLEPDDFFGLRNQWVYEAMLALHAKGIAIDYLTLGDELKLVGRLDEIGGNAYLTYLLNNTPTYLHYNAYAVLVFRSAMRRYMLAYASECAQIATNPNLDATEALDKINAKLTHLNARIAEFEQNEDDSAGAISERIVDNYLDRKPVTKYPTGITVLDTALGGGLQRGKFMVVAGYTGHGKTMLKKQIALNMAGSNDPKTGKPLNVLYLALEGSQDDIINRMISQMTGVNTQHIEDATTPPNPNCNLCNGSGYTPKGNECDCRVKHQQKVDTDIASAQYKMSTYRLTVKAGNFSVASTKRICLREHNINPLDLIVVDYLQKVETTGYKSDIDAVGAYADLMAWLAVEFNCMVMAGSQFNRVHTIDTNKVKEIIPQASDLAKNSQIEKHADYIIAPVRIFDDTGKMTTETKLWYLKLRSRTPQPYSPLQFVEDYAMFGLKAFALSRYDKKGK